jgi:hypothetical protein
MSSNMAGEALASRMGCVGSIDFPINVSGAVRH